MGRQALKPLTARPFICGLSYASKVSGGEEVVREVLKSTFSLKRQTPIKFDHELIALEPSLTKAAKYIATGIPNHTTSWHRVPPVAVTSMARSGKTTLLHSLFNKFLDEEKFNPILVDFNGDNGFFPLDGESDYDACLRWVATSVLFEEHETVPVPAFNCTEQDLEEYLSTSPKPIVLLVDNLNHLSYLNENKRLSIRLARLLRKLFLDKPDRYLCYTSHWDMNLETVSGHERAICIYYTTKYVRLPRAQNAEEVNQVIQSKSKNNITPVQVAAHLGSVGLLVSKYDLDYDPSVQFERRTQGHKSFPVESFLDEFCFGDEYHVDMRYFDEFTTRLDGGKLAWPLCFASTFLYKAREHQLHALIERTQHAIGPQSVGSGLEWEFVARVAVAMVARCALYRDLEDIESQVIGLSSQSPSSSSSRLPSSWSLSSLSSSSLPFSKTNRITGYWGTNGMEEPTQRISHRGASRNHPKSRERPKASVRYHCRSQAIPCARHGVSLILEFQCF